MNLFVNLDSFDITQLIQRYNGKKIEDLYDSFPKHPKQHDYFFYIMGDDDPKRKKKRQEIYADIKFIEDKITKESIEKMKKFCEIYENIKKIEIQKTTEGVENLKKFCEIYESLWS